MALCFIAQSHFLAYGLKLANIIRILYIQEGILGGFVCARTAQE